MANTDPFASAVGQLAELRAGRVSAAELVEMYVKRTEKYDGDINAVVQRDFERARRAAVRADERRARGEDAALLGLPITVKDCLHLAGLPTTAGVPVRANAVAVRHSPLVASALAAGAIVLGKTNVPPNADDTQSWNQIFGRTANPWDLRLTAGGSTGGGAAALAAGFTALELGSDMSGSLRQPAAYCGVYGHKPSETALPRTGHVPGRDAPNTATCLDVQGPMARSAADLALAMDVLAAPEADEAVAWRIELPRPRRESLVGMRVAILPIPAWLEVDDEIKAALEGLGQQLAAAGASVAVAQPQFLGDLRAHHRLFNCLLYASTGSGTPARREATAREWRARGDQFSTSAARGLLAGARDYIRWYDERQRYRAAFAAFFREWDVLVTPSDCINAFPHDERPVATRDLAVNGTTIAAELQPVFPALANVSGLPATAFPCGLTRDGLPIGLQAIGPYLEDHTAIRFAGLVADLLGGFVPPRGYA